MNAHRGMVNIKKNPVVKICKTLVNKNELKLKNKAYSPWSFFKEIVLCIFNPCASIAKMCQDCVLCVKPQFVHNGVS